MRTTADSQLRAALELLLGGADLARPRGFSIYFEWHWMALDLLAIAATSSEPVRMFTMIVARCAVM